MSEPLTEYENFQLGEARRYLRHVRETVRRMKTLREQLDAERETYDMVTAVRYGEKVTVSAPEHGDDRMAAHVERISNLVAGMETEYVEYTATLVECRVALAALTAPDGYAVLSRHYLACETWPEVAAATGYDESTVRYKANRALVELWGVMPQQWRTRRYSAV